MHVRLCRSGHRGQTKGLIAVEGVRSCVYIYTDFPFGKSDGI